MPNLMRLRPVKGGKKWYTNFRNSKNYKEKIEVALDAFEHEKHKAAINLGKILQDLDYGVNPNSVNKTIGQLPKPPMDKRNDSAYRTHILPFFGKIYLRDIDEEVIEQYLKYRWGLGGNGEFRAVTKTFEKEMICLKKVTAQSLRNWSPPKVKYTPIKKVVKKPLQPEQVQRAGAKITLKYRQVFWVMAYTGMDIGDVLALTPAMIDRDRGWITKGRGKTTQTIHIPICTALESVFKEMPWPINRNQLLFPEIVSMCVTTAVTTAFRKSGAPGYSAKDLRRFVASVLLDSGYDMDWIGKALGHAPGSQVTKVYPAIYDDTLTKAFTNLDKLSVGGAWE